jgi:voltage-dependent anion channel protein 2
MTPRYWNILIPFHTTPSYSSYIYHLAQPPGGQASTSLCVYLLTPSSGISITQSWNTANLLSTKVELNDTFATGLKAEVLSNFNPAAGNKGQKLNLHFKQPNFHARGFADLQASGAASAIADVVLSHDGFLVGGEVGYDVQKAAITKYSAALGYTTGAYNAGLTATNSLSIFTASYYQKVNSAVEAGAKATWDAKQGSNVGLELAAKYKIDTASFAKVRFTHCFGRAFLTEVTGQD